MEVKYAPLENQGHKDCSVKWYQVGDLRCFDKDLSSRI
jgi:hypothetical protein